MEANTRELRFTDAESKLELAGEHLRRLDQLIQSYFEDAPYTTFREYEPSYPGNYGIRGIALTKEPPSKLS